MRKPDCCICKNRGADQLHINWADDQRLYFRYIDSTIPLPTKPDIKPLPIFRGCTARLVLDLVGYPEDRLSHDVAHCSMLPRLS